MKKLAIITTHPVQYYAPLFKLLHERKNIEIRIFYTWGVHSKNKLDPGFEKHIEWDLPLLDGYPFEWVNNTSRKPGSQHFFGIKNPGLIEQITKSNPDAILVFGWAYQSHLNVLRHFKGRLPVYFRGDSTLLDETTGGIKPLLKKWFLRWVYKHVDHVFFVGTLNRKYFLQYGIKNTMLSFTPHSVDNRRFAENRLREAEKLRDKLGLDKNDKLVLFAGKFEEKKNPNLLLKAFKQINSTNIHLLFVGNGALERKLKASSTVKFNRIKNTTGIQSRIHFMDFQNQTQMPVVYQACNVLCLPSQGPGESWGLTINEAMASGRAILASDKVGSAYDLVKEGKNGLIFKSGHLTDLKEKLEHLTSSTINLQTYGNHSKEIIREWNLEYVASVIEMRIIDEYEV